VHKRVGHHSEDRGRNSLILFVLWAWLAALDDFRNWLQLGLQAREKT
jgi:hypothetical protein